MNHYDDELRGRFAIKLYPNPLTPDNPNDLVGHVHSIGTASLEGICKSAAGRGGADISAPAMQHAVELFLREMGFQLCNGYSVNLAGYITAHVGIKGVFNRVHDDFDGERHKVAFEFQTGATLRKVMPFIQVDVTGLADSGLKLLHIEDVASGSINDQLTPGNNLRVFGHKVKVAGDDPEVGIYFVGETTRSRVKVAANQIAVNANSQLLFIIPALANSTYHLEVTTQYSNAGSNLKAPRTFKFEKPLSVGPVSGGGTQTPDIENPPAPDFE
ncbi:hypothetical protein FACS1894181_10450 [Bacteroidia bacterium]|nr:hypothetical protein FACS1894181_10450 [Bacteroidia bacterium]